MLRDDLNNTYNNLNKKSVGCGKLKFTASYKAEKAEKAVAEKTVVEKAATQSVKTEEATTEQKPVVVQ